MSLEGHRDVAKREGCVLGRGGGPWEFSLLSTQFCYELKTPLKSKVFFLMA